MRLDLVGRLRRLLGVSSARVPVYENSGHDPRVVHRVSESFRVTDPATGRVKTYRDRNELPESMRELLDQAGSVPREPSTRIETHHEFHIADPDGNVRVYNSLDEMPPEIRRLFG